MILEAKQHFGLISYQKTFSGVRSLFYWFTPDLIKAALKVMGGHSCSFAPEKGEMLRTPFCMWYLNTDTRYFCVTLGEVSCCSSDTSFKCLLPKENFRQSSCLDAVEAAMLPLFQQVSSKTSSLLTLKQTYWIITHRAGCCPTASSLSWHSKEEPNVDHVHAGGKRAQPATALMLLGWGPALEQWNSSTAFICFAAERAEWWGNLFLHNSERKNTWKATEQQ